MPIRPENRDRYPKDWPEISRRIRLVRAQSQCECVGECGPQHTPRPLPEPARAARIRHRQPCHPHRRAPEPHTRGLPRREPACDVPGVPPALRRRAPRADPPADAYGSS